MKKQTWLLLSLLVSLPSAADFIIDSPINFGEIAIRNNTSVSTLTIHRNGAFQSTNHIFIIEPGSPGVFTLNGLPPFTNVNLTADLPVSSTSPIPDTAQFTITAVDMPSSINMGPTGSAQFKVGGTLSTSGNPAKNYFSGAEYLIFLNINIDY